jgi:hypothetical protein
MVRTGVKFVVLTGAAIELKDFVLPKKVDASDLRALVNFVRLNGTIVDTASMTVGQ